MQVSPKLPRSSRVLEDTVRPQRYPPSPRARERAPLPRDWQNFFRGTRARARRRRGSRRYRTLESSAASPTPACPLLPPPAAGVVPLTALLPRFTSQARLCGSRAPRAARWARGRRADVVAAAAEPVRAHQPTCTPAKSGARRCPTGRRRVAIDRGVELSKGAAAALGVRGRRHGQGGGGRGGRGGGGAGGRVCAAPVALEAG